MRRKFAQPSLPNLYFRDGILSIPGYTFEKATAWQDTGSLSSIAVGTNLKDGTNVLAKIAPATGNGSICLEREAHLLERLRSSSEYMSTALRSIDFISIGQDSGNCVVLLMYHPGINTLGRYFPRNKVNELLLADVARARPHPTLNDIYTLGTQESYDDLETFDVMDLASFLEFAIQATHCIEMIHKIGFIHREVRPNAFHVNAHSGLVRFAHFGNRSISLEQFGGPSALVIKADGMEEAHKQRVKEALCFLAPEQTGSVETSTEDHRTDLYSLGILFWCLLVGQGQVPFEGSPMEILHAVAQKRPMPVHEVRRDVPHVLAQIIEKLVQKNPDLRYFSAHGLKVDLLECQKRLLAAVSSMSDQALEHLIPSFEIGREDKYLDFTIPNVLFGREKELNIIRSAIRHANNARQRSSRNASIITSSANSHFTNAIHVEDASDGESVGSETSNVSDQHEDSGRLHSVRSLQYNEINTGRISRTRSILVSGPAGAGKSSLIMANQAKWRSHGLWGHAKFQNAAAVPFAALLSCLSSVLRQLMVFQTDLHRFLTLLKSRLGPQLHNAPLLYQGAPELKDIFIIFDIKVSSVKEPLSTLELRVRFQSLVEQIFSVIAEVRLLALFLDDLHEADDSSLDLITTLANSKSPMLLLGSVRSDDPAKLERIRTVFGTKSRLTCISLEPLNLPAVSSLITKTIHRGKEDCAQLTRLIYRISTGNAFAVRNLLTNLHRRHQITFDWDENHWVFDVDKIDAFLAAEHGATDPSDLNYLVLHLRELPEDGKKYIIWASFFGVTFKANEVALMMDWEDTGSNVAPDEEADATPWRLSKAISTMRESSLSTSRGSMRGLQIAIAEGWLVQRARDMCSFTHDKYFQAAAAEAQRLPEETMATMSFRIVLMLLHDNPPDSHRIAEHGKRCMKIIRDHAKREEVLDRLIEAGVSAWTRGAHEHALESLMNARALLSDKAWTDNVNRTISLLLRVAELLNWKGDLNASENILGEILDKVDSSIDKAQVLRIQSRNRFFRNDFAGALQDTLQALATLGIEINDTPTRKETDELFEQVKNELLAVGFDNILSIPRANDSRIDLAVQLLNDAGTNAYFGAHDGFSDVIGLTTIHLALRSGMCPGTALGFFWALGAAAERKEMYRFSVDLGRLALRIADKYGGSAEKCRAQLLYTAMVSGYENIHVRVNIPRSELVIKYGLSAGDRVYAAFGLLHSLLNRLSACEHLSELIVIAEEAINDATIWTPDSDVVFLIQAVVNLIRALSGYTDSSSAETSFDTETFKDKDYVAYIERKSGNLTLTLNWYNSCKVVGYYCLGYTREAAELGFDVYKSLHFHPCHRHLRFALCYHSLALIDVIREGKLNEDTKNLYLTQIDLNRSYIKKWLSPSPVNTSAWVALVDAELSTVLNSTDAFRLFDIASQAAVANEFLMEEGWALFLQGAHFMRCGVFALGNELQRRGILRQSQWGARGIVNHLNSIIGQDDTLKDHRSFRKDIGVQTENLMIGLHATHNPNERSTKVDTTDTDEISLSSTDLTAILKWSKDISSDISLSSALRRLTEIAAEKSGAQNACIVIAREAGDYTVATSMLPPESCQVHENPKSLRTVTDPLQRAVVLHCLNSKVRVVFDDSAVDSRFYSESQGSSHRSVICLPIFSNRGQTFGALYLSSGYSFSSITVQVLSLLLQQASISIANALLFRSVQAGTRENLKMIAAQKAALEEARRSREDALKATKIKSNFLASMSHELRTPFSSFYGLLDILSGTDLNEGQREIVETAKQSCEILLKIIDSILDYSKLEASALKLEYSPFLVEDIIADCMELLLPMAARKLDMSFNIEPNVPEWVLADYARIRQVLMNLIGNGVKFTLRGEVRVICSLDQDVTPELPPGQVYIKFAIQDTGIGMSANDLEMLFVPFQQADNSSTRRFGGTGLGLSISRQLVKLMGGEIGVESRVGVGSIFWFRIPVKLHETEQSKKAMKEIEEMKSLLLRPRTLRIILASPSDVTRSLLINMLKGFHVTAVSSIDDIENQLQQLDGSGERLDFIILDYQPDIIINDLTKKLHAMESEVLKETKIVHLYTPTSEALLQQQKMNGTQLGVMRMTKPPRKARLLQILASLKDISGYKIDRALSDITRAVDSVQVARRTLFGNVLIAEDNPIAQDLLKKQLSRFQLNVVATSNGIEAVEAWESHEPGYFSLAMFDHHMPICDGIEACKRIRISENKQKLKILLPIIALSADCQESTKQLCLSAGMNEFLSKPMRKADLQMLLTKFGSSDPVTQPA